MTQPQKTVLAVGAHPDDVEVVCGGALLRLREEGWRTVMCAVTNGDKGHQSLSSPELADIRAQESKAASEILGAELVMLDFEDARLEVTLENRDRIIDMLRTVRPDRVITHALEDYHPDHAATAQMIFDAAYISSVGLVKTDHPALGAPFEIWMMEPYAGFEFTPDRYIDITAHQEQKIAALACHKSQLEWIGNHDNLDLLDAARITSEFRGLQSGVRHAEAFKALQRAPLVKAE